MTILSISSAIVSIASAVAVLLALLKNGRKILGGQRCLLRTVIMTTYYRHADDKALTEYEMENFLLCYESYKALGGNSFADIIYKEVTTWNVIKSAV